ncbi:MAG: 2-C-methyl-D-erythritol 4-phosphate cytidylyltransferase [Desulfobacterales bacterium]|nr:2-C-methyl-D-erythritol 4-phosphate cytidylyltransferase [Desulfobacterales bacterium]
MRDTDHVAILVAGGSGHRMGKELPKQFLQLDDLPIISHTLKILDATELLSIIYIVLPEAYIDFCKYHILQPLQLNKHIVLVKGGIERQDSVYNGLLAIDQPKSNTIVVVHDAVRPFIQASQVDSCIQKAIALGSCILAIPIMDTIKQVNSTGYIEKTISRDHLFQAQTPQAFQYAILFKAHVFAREHNIIATDDAFLVESMGLNVAVIEGSRMNIKITTPDDLIIAKSMVHMYKNSIFRSIVPTLQRGNADRDDSSSRIEVESV